MKNVPFVLANQELGTVSQVQSDQGCCPHGFMLVAGVSVAGGSLLATEMIPSPSEQKCSPIC